MDYQLFNLLYHCSREFSHKKLRLEGLSSTESMLCSYIYSNSGCTQEQAAAALKIDKTTVAKALYTLEEKGCIVRTSDTLDRRKKRLCLSPDGMQRVESLVQRHDSWLSQVLSCLTAAEQSQFESYCKRLLTAADTLSEKKIPEGEK